MKERWERFLTATKAQKSRLKTAPTAVESFMAQGCHRHACWEPIFWFQVIRTRSLLIDELVLCS